MNLIVDTNIIFSAILNEKSRIGRILTNHHKHFEFYSCNYLKVELKKYYPKIAMYARKTVEEVIEIESLATANIKFINEEVISKDYIINAEHILKDIDPNDMFFLALANFVDATLWTGDKKLAEGLKMKGCSNVISTEELILKIELLELGQG